MHAMTMIPGFSFMIGDNWGECVAAAMGELKTTDSERTDVAELASQKLQKLITTRPSNESIRKYWESTRNIEILIAGSRYQHSAHHELFQAVVTKAWSAIEILLKDLWHSVTPLRLEFQAVINSVPKEERARTFTFLNLPKTRKTYLLTFKSDPRRIDEALKDNALDALSLLRHLIVHAGGKLDKTFMDRSNGNALLKSIRAAGRHSEAEFTGEVIRPIIDRSAARGYEVLTAVDNWLFFNS